MTKRHRGTGSVQAWAFALALGVGIPAIAATRGDPAPEVTSAATPDSAAKPHVLILYSYSTLRSYMLQQQAAIHRTIDPKGISGTWSYIVYEETMSYDGIESFDEDAFVERLRSRYARVPLDLIIATDTPAVELLGRRWNECLPKAPLIFSAPTYVPESLMSADVPVTGVVEADPIPETVALARQLFPSTKRVLMLLDSENNSERQRSSITGVASKLGLTIEYPTSLGRDACIERLRHAPDDSIILYHSLPKNAPWVVDDLYRIYEDANRPVFCVYEAHVGIGAFGGVVADATTYGRAAGAIAKRVLEGEDVRRIPINLHGLNRPIVDARQLNRWGVARRRLPAATEFRFERRTWWSEYSREIIAWSFGGLIVGVLATLLWRERRASRAITQSAERFRALGENLPGMVYQTLLMPDGSRRAEFLGPRLELLIGVESARRVRENWEHYFDLIHPEDAHSIFEERRDAVAERRIFSCDYRLRSDDGRWRWVRSIAQPVMLPGGVVRWHGLLLDVHEVKETERALARRDAILNAVARVSRLLVRSATLKEVIPEALECLGRAAGVERAYLFDRPSDSPRPSSRMLGEWCAPGVRPQIGDASFALLRDADWDTARWIHPLREGRSIARSIPDFESNEREFFAAQSIQSLLIVPIHVESEWWGFVGFDSCVERVSWSRGEIVAIEAAAQSIAAAIERERRDDRIRERDAALNSVASNIPGFVYRVAVTADEWVRLEAATSGYSEVFGVEPSFDAVRLTDPNPKYADEGRAKAIVAMRRCMRTLEPLDIVVPASSRAGTPRWIHIRATASRRGTETVFDGVVIDVTDRTRAEDAYRRSEERYRLASRAGNDIIWDWDIASGILSWNEALARVLGFPESLRETDLAWWAKRIHPDDRAHVESSLLGAIDDRSSMIWMSSYRFQRADGEWIDVQDRGYIVRDPGGRAVRAVGAMMDVTTARRAAAELRSSEQRYRSLVEALPVGVMIHDGSVIFYANPSLLHLLGCGEHGSEPLPSIASILLKADLPRAAERCSMVLEKGCLAPPIEQSLVRRDGSVVTVELRCAPIEHAGRRAIHTTIVDLTERVRQEFALHEAEARSRLIVESTNAIFWEADARTLNFTFVSGKSTSVTGFSADEWLAPGFWASRLHPDDLRWAPSFCKALTEQGKDHSFEYRFRRADGQYIWLRDVASIVRDDTGANTRIRGVMIDVSDSKATQAALEDREQRLRQITESAHEVFWLTNLRRESLEYISPSFEVVWGIPATRVLEDFRVFIDALHPDDRELFQKATADRAAAFDIEYRIIRPDGKTRWIRDRAYPVRDESGTIIKIAGCAEDVTERHHAEQSLFRSNEVLHLLLSELDHRVKNSLSGLLTLVDLSTTTAVSVGDFARSIRARLTALAAVHGLLSESHWTAVPIDRMLRTLLPPDFSAKFECRGPSLEVPARQVTALAMVLQELLTNCQKYGVGPVAEGMLRVEWEVVGRRVTLRWNESGGPSITAPVKQGVGLRLIEGFCRFELEGSATFNFRASGVEHTFQLEFDENLDDTRPIAVDSVLSGAYATSLLASASRASISNPT